MPTSDKIIALFGQYGLVLGDGRRCTVLVDS
jgi:hypothetical protein